MFSFSNAILIAVTSYTIIFCVSHPSLALEMATAFGEDVFFTFSANQWRIIIPIFLLALLGPAFLYYKLRNTKFEYNGRYLVAQSLGVTAEDRGIASKTDETNQTTENGASPQTKTSLQVQVAPSIREDIELKKAKEVGHYSTPMYVGQYSFTSTMNPGDQVFYIESNQIYTNNNIKRLFLDKRFARFDIRFTVNVTGNPMATGVLGVASIPYGNLMPGSVATQDSTANYSWTNLYARILSSNHTLMDMSVDGVHKIDMPFTYYKSFLSTFNFTTANPYAALVCCVYSPYLPPTGQTGAINIEVYASIINVETIETAPYNTQSLLSIGETTNVVSQIDHCNNVAVPQNVTGDHISASVPSPVGLDCPPDPRNAQISTFRMAYQKLTSFWNKVDVYKTSSTPQEEAIFDKPVSDDLRVDVDEMSMDFFRGRWFYPDNTGAIYPITTSTATGARICKFDLTPIPLSGGFSTNFSSSSTCDFSQWLTSFFRFWRGSLRYRIVVASNSFKRGKILVCVNYGGLSNALPPTIGSGTIDPRSLHHIIIDLSNKDRIIDIDIPYKSVFEYLRVPNLTALDPARDYTEFSMGTIAAYLVSPLQVSNGTATTVNLSVFQCFGEDFNLYKRAQLPTAGYSTQSNLAIEGPSTSTVRKALMVPFEGLQQLCRTQLTPIGTYPLFGQGVPPQRGVEPVVFPIHPVLLSSDALWTGITAMYSGMRGGYRIVLRFNDVERGSSFRVQYFDSLGPVSGTGVPAANGTYSVVSTAGIWNSWRGNNGYPQLNEMSFSEQSRIPGYLNSLAVAGNTPGAIQAYGLPAVSDFIVDPYSQPEVILEVSDPAPMYRSQQTLRCPGTNVNGYDFGGNGKYDPTEDYNMGWLVIHPIDNGTGYNDTAVVGTVSVALTAADDFRAFWYNGGPTTIFPACTGYIETGQTSYTYRHMQGR